MMLVEHVDLICHLILPFHKNQDVLKHSQNIHNVKIGQDLRFIPLVSAASIFVLSSFAAANKGFHPPDTLKDIYIANICS